MNAKVETYQTEDPAGETAQPFFTADNLTRLSCRIWLFAFSSCRICNLSSCRICNPAVTNISIYFPAESDTLIDFVKAHCNAEKKQNGLQILILSIFGLQIRTYQKQINQLSLSKFINVSFYEVKKCVALRSEAIDRLVSLSNYG